MQMKSSVLSICCTQINIKCAPLYFLGHIFPGGSPPPLARAIPPRLQILFFCLSQIMVPCTWYIHSLRSLNSPWVIGRWQTGVADLSLKGIAFKIVRKWAANTVSEGAYIKMIWQNRLPCNLCELEKNIRNFLIHMYRLRPLNLLSVPARWQTNGNDFSMKDTGK